MYVRLREVGPRDGLQIIPIVVPTAAKIAWIKSEFEAGVKEFEVCSFVPSKIAPQFADRDDVVRFAMALQGLTVAALVPNLKGAEHGINLGVHKLNFVMSVSESHNQANVRRSAEESVQEFGRIASLLTQIPRGNRPKLVGGLSTAFGCSIEGPVDEDRVTDLAIRLVEAGADELTIADTVGFASPDAVRRVFSSVRRWVDDRPIAAHFHDTRGLGLANALAALDVGICHFDASLGGLGGCPFAPGATGNVATEDLAFLFESMGLDTGIDIEALSKARGVIAEALPEEPLLARVAKAGLPKDFVYRRERRHGGGGTGHGRVDAGSK